MNPLIGRTCLVRMPERTTTFKDGREPLHEPDRVVEGLIMDVTPVHKHERAGDCMRDQFDGWRLLCLLDGGELRAVDIDDVRVQ